jgi:hypothetical protein
MTKLSFKALIARREKMSALDPTFEESGFEHSYSITCSKRCFKMDTFWWSDTGFQIGF